MQVEGGVWGVQGHLVNFDPGVLDEERKLVAEMVQFSDSCKRFKSFQEVVTAAAFLHKFTIML